MWIETAYRPFPAFSVRSNRVAEVVSVLATVNVPAAIDLSRHAERRASKEQQYGETRTRTGDTTIFSRVLYQLSYLAVEPRG